MLHSYGLDAHCVAQCSAIPRQATTGSCGFVEHDVLVKQPDLEVIAKNAVNWILSTTQKNGMIPYIITPPQTNGFGKVYQPITYSAESFIDVYMRYPDMRATIQNGLNSTIKFLVANQSADGS